MRGIFCEEEMKALPRYSVASTQVSLGWLQKLLQQHSFVLYINPLSPYLRLLFRIHQIV